MNTDLTNVEARARLHAALADSARLAIVDRLAVSDVSPGELGRLSGLPTNLVAHHLGVLESAGLVRRIRSEGDRRRAYVRLVPEVLGRLTPPPLLASPPRVVFVCTHNSARSQMAAALLLSRSGFPAASAGTVPAERVHPRAVKVGRRHGLDLARARPTHVADVVAPDDLVVSVCDAAHERLGTGEGRRLHWSVRDPARVDTDQAFEAAFADLAARVERLVPVLGGGRR